MEAVGPHSSPPPHTVHLRGERGADTRGDDLPVGAVVKHAEAAQDLQGEQSGHKCTSAVAHPGCHNCPCHRPLLAFTAYTSPMVATCVLQAVGRACNSSAGMVPALLLHTHLRSRMSTGSPSPTSPGSSGSCIVGCSYVRGTAPYCGAPMGGIGAESHAHDAINARLRAMQRGSAGAYCFCGPVEWVQSHGGAGSGSLRPTRRTHLHDRIVC